MSWSRLKNYEACKQKVLRQKEGKSNKAVDGRVFLPGTVADRCMRAYLELDDPKPGGILEPLDELLERYAFHDEQYVIRWRGGDQKADLAKVREIVVLVLTNLEPILWDLIIPHGYQPEVRFERTIGIPYLDGRVVPITLIGGIDILTKTLVDPLEYGIYDLKATTNDSYVRGDILAQLVFYAIAVRALFGVYPSRAAFLTPACKERVVPVQITEQDVRHMMSRIVAYAQGVWRNEWDPKDAPDGDCFNCDVKHACDLYALPPGRNLTFAELASRRKK